MNVSILLPIIIKFIHSLPLTDLFRKKLLLLLLNFSKIGIIINMLLTI